jgi:hypothetical protein
MVNNSRDGEGAPRRPVAEPEILPPDRAQEPSDRTQEMRADQFFVRQRVFIAPPGPLGAVLAFVALAAIAASGVLLFLGLFLFLLPVVGAMVAGFLIAALLRGPRRL